MKMENFEKVRIAYFGDVAKPTKLVIELQDSLPLVNLSDNAGIDGTGLIVDSRVLSSEPTVFNTKLKYIDNDGVEVTDRYIFITVIPSLVSKSRGLLYYDSYNKDMFIIPDTEVFHGDVGSNEYLNNNKFSITASHVGLVGSRKIYIETLKGMLPITEHTNVKLPEMKAVTDVEVRLLTLPGISENSQFNNFGYNAGGNYYESKRNNILQFVSIGSVDNVFVDTDVKVPLHKIVNVGLNNYNMLYIGDHVCNDIMIPVNF